MTFLHNFSYLVFAYRTPLYKDSITEEFVHFYVKIIDIGDIMKTKIKIYGILAFVFFVLLAMFVEFHVTSGFDQFIYSLIIKMKSPTITSIMKNISHLASFAAVIVVCVCLFIWRYRVGLWFMVFMMINSGIGQLAKHLFLRQRPNSAQLIAIGGYSFPSAHALTAMAMYGFLIYCLCQQTQSKKVRYLLITVFASGILLVGVSRIYLGVHYASDVLAGYLLSFAYLVLFQYFVEKKKIKSFYA